MRAARHLLNPLRWLVQPPSRVVGAMSLKPTDRVLEVGCGPGWFSPHLAAAVHRGSLACADAQPGMLRLAGTRLAGRPNASMHAADACALPFVDASFDAVLLAHVLGEVADPVSCLREARRVLGRDGALTVVESRRDGDFIPIGRLAALAAAAGMAIRSRRGPRWEYAARLVASPDLP